MPFYSKISVVQINFLELATSLTCNHVLTTLLPTYQVKEAAVKCLLCVVRKVNVTDTSVFLSVFDNVSSMIFPSEKTNFSDELIHLALQVGLASLPGTSVCFCSCVRLYIARYLLSRIYRYLLSRISNFWLLSLLRSQELL